MFLESDLPDHLGDPAIDVSLGELGLIGRIRQLDWSEAETDIPDGKSERHQPKSVGPVQTSSRTWRAQNELSDRPHKAHRQPWRPSAPIAIASPCCSVKPRNWRAGSRTRRSRRCRLREAVPAAAASHGRSRGRRRRAVSCRPVIDAYPLETLNHGRDSIPTTGLDDLPRARLTPRHRG